MFTLALNAYPLIQLQMGFATNAEVSVDCIVLLQLSEPGFPIVVMPIPDEAYISGPAFAVFLVGVFCVSCAARLPTYNVCLG